MAGEQPGNNLPAENAGTPPAGNGTPSQPSTEETVTLSKTEHDNLQKKAAQASSAQREAESARRQALQFNKRKLEKPEYLDNSELIKAKDIITAAVLGNRDYQDLVNGNPVLANALTRDPSILLNEDSFVDAQDFANQVLIHLDGLIASKPNIPPVQPTPPTDPAPMPSNPSPPDNGPAAETEQQRKEKEMAGRPPLDRIASKLSGRIKFE